MIVVVAFIVGGIVYTACVGAAWELLRGRASDEVVHAIGALAWPLALPAVFGARTLRRLQAPRQPTLPAATVHTHHEPAPALARRAPRRSPDRPA